MSDSPASAVPDDDRFLPGARGGIAIALLCGLVAAIGFALNAPLFALTLSDQGVGDAAVGLLVTVAGVAAIVCTPAVPWLMGRLSVKLILAGAMLVTAAMFGLYTQVEGALAWTAIRFGFAAALTTLFVTSEAWFLELAPARYRGRLLGLYAATFAGGFGVGGLLLAWLGHQGPAAPLAGAAVALAALPLIALVPARPATRPEGAAASPLALLARLRLAPALFVPALAMGAIETAAFNLFPLWVRRVGFEDSAAGLLIAASALGNVLLQGPIGVLADRVGRDRTLVLVSVVAILGPVLLALAQAPWQAYAAAFVWSGCVTGFYTLGLMGLAQQFRSGDLAGANAAYAASYGVGQMVAPALGGLALAAGGSAGFMALLSVIAILPLATVLLTRQPVSARP